MSFFDDVKALPEDPIFSLQVAFQNDSRKKKVNLGIGAYRDAEGHAVVLNCVQKAEKILLDRCLNKDYLPIVGNHTYIIETAKLIFGEKENKIFDGSLFGAQTVGGTAALRIGGEFLSQKGVQTIYLPNLTWANHKLVFQRAGLKVDYYPYYNTLKHQLDFSEMCKALRAMNPGSVIILHGTSHNPTGINPTMEQWRELSSLIKEQNLFPFFDMAYQGFNVGLEEDAAPICHFLKEGHEFLTSYTYSKNMGLYGERVGALFAILNNKEQTQKIGSHLKQIIRALYSNPPIHGALIVETVLKNESLKNEWKIELKGMKERIDEMRRAFITGLLSKSYDKSYQFMNQQQSGFFAYTGMNHDQIHRLKQDFAIYAPDGRVNVAGLNSNNMDYVIESIMSV